MLDANDLRQIGELLVENNKVLKVEIKNEIVPEIVDQIVGQVGEMLEQNMFPQFDKLDARITKIETTMVTKDYLDEKLGKVNGKIAVLTDVLHANGTITGDQRGLVRMA